MITPPEIDKIAKKKYGTIKSMPKQVSLVASDIPVALVQSKWLESLAIVISSLKKSITMLPTMKIIIEVTIAAPIICAFLFM